MRNFFRRWLGIEALHTELYERLPGVRNEVNALFKNAVELNKRVELHEASVGALRREVLGRLDELEVRITKVEAGERFLAKFSDLMALRKDFGMLKDATAHDAQALFDRIEKVESCVASAITGRPASRYREVPLKPAKKKPTRK